MRDIFHTPEVMDMLKVITPFEEAKYSDIPSWDGWIENWTTSAVLLHLNMDPPRVKQNQYWFPISQLRKAEDGQSIYATIWILEKKGL